MKNKIISTAFLLLLTISSTNAQETFQYIHEFSSSRFIELENNRYAISFSDSLIIFAETGNILEARNFYPDTCENYLFGFHRTADNRLFSTGYYDYVIGKHFFLWVREYDQDMNPINETKHKIPIHNRAIFRGFASIVDSDNNAVFAFATADHPGLNNDSLELFKVFTDSDSVFRSTPTELPVSIRDLTEISDNNYYLIGEELWGYSSSVVRFSSDLNIKELGVIDSFKNAVGIYKRRYSHIEKYSDSSYMFTAERSVPSKNYRAVGMGIADTTRTMLKENFFTLDSTSTGFSTYEGYITYFDPDKIFIGSLELKAVDGWYIPVRMILTKVDDDLNVQWQRFYKPYDEDYSFHIQDIHATSDGGVILITRLYKYNETPTIVFKVDSFGNGPFMLTGQEELLKSCELFLYPNPGSGTLNIRTAVQRLGGRFELFDMSGRAVLSQNITQSLTSLNTSHLPAGNYIFRYTHDGLLVESGKWMKK